MKIGDKVRFLSDVGGGIVAGFQGNNVVLVEDADGFQIPTPVTDVVVVEEDNYDSRQFMTPTLSAQKGKTNAAGANVSAMATDEDEEVEPSDMPITFRAMPEERKGGDLLSVYLAFVPVNVKELTNTRFEAYLVNDSNYYVRYNYMVSENASFTLRSTALVEPNTKVFIEEFGREDLSSLEHVAMQLMAHKEGKPFIIKPVVDARLRIDTVKFYKLHTFQENDFFEQPALIYTVVERDKPVRPLVVDAKKLRQEMASKVTQDTHKPTAARVAKAKDAPNAPLVVDLHASELLETTQGLSSADILNYQLDTFRKTVDANLQHVGKKLVFVHGKGEGVLRSAIIHELNYRYKWCVWQDASFQEYGYGATQVTIRNKKQQ